MLVAFFFKKSLNEPTVFNYLASAGRVFQSLKTAGKRNSCIDSLSSYGLDIVRVT